MNPSTLFLTIIILLTPAFAAANQPSSSQGSIAVEITGFENSQGVARVALANSRENYESETPFRGFNFKIVNNRVSETITGLPYGEYAVKVYHDENQNNEMDTRMFGIPTERYGFSNDARGSFGPPEFEKASFRLDSRKLEITFKVQ
ncbi:MAG: DUF2141 domain-containing protein [Desulfobacterales bacterium]|nr:DUF2141 domain-containing protein [Desulfobacterales bacterium]